MEPPPAPARLEQIFADLGAPSIQAVPVAGAVDIRAIAPARPVVEPKPEPQPAAPPPVSAAEARKAAAKEAEAAKAPAARGTAAKGAKAAAATPCPPPAKGKATRGSTTAKGKAASADACEVVEETTKAGAKKAPAKKAAPSHPSRIWVQVGVGRDKGAIAFDWRRWAKQAPAAFKGRSPSITDMGRTNRILVGPFATQKAASDYLAQLKKAKFDDAFVWTSPAGQAVDALSAD